MVHKISTLFLIMLVVFSSQALAHDGENIDDQFTAEQIAPFYGNTEVGVDNHYTGFKYVYHYLYWKPTQTWEAYLDSNAYDGNSPSSLEIDINFRGYDGDNVYTTQAISESQSVKGEYWGSDMPYAFIDTSEGDNPDEPGVGLASGNWWAASSDYWYEAWSYVNDGNSDFDDFKVSVARGHHHDYAVTPAGTCSGYTNPWCYYTDGPSTKRVHSWQGNAPGYHDWVQPMFENWWYDPSHDYNTP